jgi:hypothetical protein
MTRVRVLLSLTLAAWFGMAWYVAMVSAQGTMRPGDPIAGLTPQQFAEFRLGLDDFLEVETPDDGLGPRSTAPAARPVTTCRPWAEPESCSKRASATRMPTDRSARSTRQEIR